MIMTFIFRYKKQGERKDVSLKIQASFAPFSVVQGSKKCWGVFKQS